MGLVRIKDLSDIGEETRFPAGVLKAILEALAAANEDDATVELTVVRTTDGELMVDRPAEGQEIGFGGGGGGGGTPASLSGNAVETLFDNRASTETAFSYASGAISWAKTFDVDLGRALTEDDDDKDLRIRFSYNQSSNRRVIDLMVNVGEFRSWTEFETATGTTGVPVGNQKFSISRGVGASPDLDSIWNRQGMVFRRGDDGGNHVLGIVFPAGDNNSGYLAVSNMRGVVLLVPPVSAITVSGGGGGGGVDVVNGLPAPSEDYVDTVVVNAFDRKEWIGRNEPYRTDHPVATWESLRAYLTDGDANLTIIHHVFPEPNATAYAAGRYLYDTYNNTFYKIAQPSTGNYAWHHVGAAEALREVAHAYFDANEGGELPGDDTTDVVYLGEGHDDDGVTEVILPQHEIDLTDGYYIYFNFITNDFEILTAYTEAMGLVDHYVWRPVRAEAFNRSSGRWPAGRSRKLPRRCSLPTRSCSTSRGHRTPRRASCIRGRASGPCSPTTTPARVTQRRIEAGKSRYRGRLVSLTG